MLKAQTRIDAWYVNCSVYAENKCIIELLFLFAYLRVSDTDISCSAKTLNIVVSVKALLLATRFCELWNLVFTFTLCLNEEEKCFLLENTFLETTYSCNISKLSTHFHHFSLDPHITLLYTFPSHFLFHGENSQTPI